MNRKPIRLASAVVLVALVATVLAFAGAGQAHAAAYKANIGYGDPLKVGGATFKLTQYYDGSSYVYKITRTKSAKTKVLAMKAGATFVTNGKYLFYSSVSSKTNKYAMSYQTIYRLDIKTGGKKKIAAGYGFEARACSGKYLYCGGGGYNYEPSEGLKLYAVNVKTKKKTYMRDGAGKVVYSNGKVLVTTNTGDAGNLPIHIFNANGKGKKKVADALTATIKGKRIYYCKISDSYSLSFKVYSCNFKCKDRKSVTGWLSDYPSSYFV